MTKIEALKELLRYNLDEINSMFFRRLSIVFKGDEFIVVDCNNKTVLVDNILDYDLNFRSQKKFIFNILRKLFKFIRDDDTFECEFIEADCEEDICRIVGYRDYMYAKYYVEIVRGDVEDDIFEKIASKLDSNNIEVFYYDNHLDFKGFYIGVVIYEVDLNINYIVDNKYYDFNSIRKFLKEDTVTIYYSDVDEKEAVKAMEYIKKLLNN